MSVEKDQPKNLELNLSEFFLKFGGGLVMRSFIFLKISFLSLFSLFCDSFSSLICAIPKVFS